MIYYSKVTSQPTEEPVTLDEAKDQLRIRDFDEDDDYITSLITVARQLCEKDAGLSFYTQTRVLKLDHFPSWNKPIILPYGPVQSITTFAYTDSSGAARTMTENTDYKKDLDSDLANVVSIDGWPDTDLDVPNSVVITYVAGYSSLETIPAVIKHAILAAIATLYENREEKELGGVSRTLLDTVRVSWNAGQD